MLMAYSRNMEEEAFNNAATTSPLPYAASAVSEIRPVTHTSVAAEPPFRSADGHVPQPGKARQPPYASAAVL